MNTVQTLRLFALMAAVSVASCAARQEHARATAVLVNRFVSDDGTTDVITVKGRIALVREAVPPALKNGPFDMPPSYAISTTRSAFNAHVNFDNAFRQMNCGTSWRRVRIAKTDAALPGGEEWRIFSSSACGRAEIVSGKRIIFQEVKVRRSPLILVTHVGG